VKKNGPILWYGKYVDFGSFEESVNKFTNQKEIEMTFSLESFIPSRKYFSEISTNEENANYSTTVVIARDNRIDSYIRKCEICLNDNILEIEFSSEGRIQSFLVNNCDFLEYFSTFQATYSKGLLPYLRRTQPLPDLGIANYEYHSSQYRTIITNELKKYVDPRTSLETLYEILRRIEIGSSSYMLKNFKSIPQSLSHTWDKNVSKWELNSMEFIDFKNIVLANSCFDLFSSINDYISSFAENIKYIAPVRATAERYYRFQNLSVDEVDFQGQNLAMFLRNLSDIDKRKFSDWAESYFGFYPQASMSHGHISIEVSQGSKNMLNLADIGFGYSQVLPILAELWQLGQKKIFATRRINSNPVTFAIEQPELHLHPRMQGRLANVFSSIIDFEKTGNPVNLIIETHSESLINSFGRLVSTGKLKRSDISILLFEKDGPSSNTKVIQSSFDEKGFLQNWPYGFFDPDLE